ncbi:MAG: site-specific DNA-methyltransferase [Chitinivibrionales bacterium]|nr:site-specific DNA-methyltransferase [Chitinivibrionales bacterium]
METTHQIYFKSSQELSEIPDDSVELIVTSPPYPMIEMWDELFFAMNPAIKRSFDERDFQTAFLFMHDELNKTWRECSRVLADGGIFCINIGDATRTLNKDFQLWSNHTLINKCLIFDLKLKPLPVILWRKSTNKPNKFMGSGMLPPNAYVTLEHEYVLIYRKGLKRELKDEGERRYESAFFWEERNNWFSDVWFDIRGTKQQVNKEFDTLRQRSAAYPLELVRRLIAMFSVTDDTVLDPFWGTGTTSIAAMLLGRNSIGYELNSDFLQVYRDSLSQVEELSTVLNAHRLAAHREFISQRKEAAKHTNDTYRMQVITGQERKIVLYDVQCIEKKGDALVKVIYKPHYS